MGKFPEIINLPNEYESGEHGEGHGREASSERPQSSLLLTSCWWVIIQAAELNVAFWVSGTVRRSSISKEIRELP